MRKTRQHRRHAKKCGWRRCSWCCKGGETGDGRDDCDWLHRLWLFGKEKGLSCLHWPGERVTWPLEGTACCGGCCLWHGLVSGWLCKERFRGR